jgi:ribose-phosphate pyrophosphokinase
MAVNIFGTTVLNPLPVPIDYKHFTFSAGEEQVRVGDVSPFNELVIKTNITNSRDLVELVMVLNSVSHQLGLKTTETVRVVVDLPYLPYSRQDRVCYPGEAFGLEQLVLMVTSSMLQGIEWVVNTWDAHSKTAEEEFNSFGVEFNNIGVNFFLEQFVNQGRLDKGIIDNLVIVAPDKGAVKRANLAAKVLGVTDIIYGEKVRDPENGEILGIIVERELPDGTVTASPEQLGIKGKPILIVDDICDGGRTFIELAKSLKTYGTGAIYLYVTHGIFSKGFEVFEGLIDQFYVANLFPAEEPYNLFALHKQ